MLNLLRNSINAIRSISGIDSDASAFITAAGLTDATQKSAINTLVKDMKASGLWTKMKAVYPMVGGTATSMKFNLKDPRDLDAAFRLTWSGGWTYSATGATPNGTNAFADTKLVPSGLTAQNSLHISAYSRTDIVQNSVIIGGYDGVVETSLYPRFTGNIIYSAINSNTSASPGSSTSSLGNFIATRLISTQEVTFINANKLTRNQSSLNNLTRAIFIGAMNYLGSANVFSSRQVSFSTIGDGLTDQDSFLLNQIVEKYQVALSRGVQAAQSFYYNSAYSNEANTYLYSTQITGTTQVSAINTLINGLKANNLWSKMKAVYPFVTDKTLQADMAAQMKFNLVNPQDSDAAFRLAFSGGWTYSTNGAQPNGTNGYADTKLNLASIGISAASNHISVYLRTNSDGVYCDIGAYNIASDYQISTYAKISNVAYVDLGVQAANRITYANTDSTGYYLASRTASNILKAFKNNILKATNTNTNTASILSRNIYISANNDVSGVTQFSNRQNAFTSIGDGLSDAEAALLYQLIQQYQTDLSRQV